VIEKLKSDLTSALFKLNDRFFDDPASLHFAVALVYSSILRKYGIPCIAVGGQSAAYWLRMPGSTDVDFVSSKTGLIAELLEAIGFQKSQEFCFRFTYPEPDVQIELVGEQIRVAGMANPETVDVEPEEVGDTVVASLMPGSAVVLDPFTVFMNYFESSLDDSIWFDFENDGALSIERAQALLALYNDHIRNKLKVMHDNGELSIEQLHVLTEKFGLFR